MKRAYLLMILLLIAVGSFAQDNRNRHTISRDADMHRQQLNKYSLMDYTQQNSKPRGSFQYHESLYNIHSKPLPVSPGIKTYQFKNDKYGVPVGKKN